MWMQVRKNHKILRFFITFGIQQDTIVPVMVDFYSCHSQETSGRGFYEDAYIP